MKRLRVVRARRRRVPFLNWLPLGAAGAALSLAVLPHLGMLAYGLIPILQALVPVFCLAAALLACAAVLSRRWFPALLLIVGALLGIMPSLVPTTNVPPASASAPLTIFSINVEHSGADVEALARVITERRVDVIVLVEVNEKLIEEVLAQGTRGSLPYRSPTVSPGSTAGTAILSRYPLTSEARIYVVDGIAAFDHPSVVLHHPRFGPVRVAGVHPYAPIVDGATMWKKIIKSIDAWQAERTEIPMILAGDFNATRAHPVFRVLAGKFTDTAAAAGRLPIPTWPARGPVPALIAIDHVLVRGLAPTGWQRITIPGTDHHGIIATVTSIEGG